MFGRVEKTHKTKAEKPKRIIASKNEEKKVPDPEPEEREPEEPNNTEQQLMHCFCPEGSIDDGHGQQCDYAVHRSDGTYTPAQVVAMRPGDQIPVPDEPGMFTNSFWDISLGFFDEKTNKMCMKSVYGNLSEFRRITMDEFRQIVGHSYTKSATKC